MRGSSWKLVWFFGLAYALTWIGWLPLVASSLGWTDRAFSPYLHLVASLGPAIAAFAMAGADGRASLVRGCLRAPPRWIAAAILVPVALFAIAAGVLVALGAEVELSKLGTNPEYPTLGLGWAVLANVVFYGFGEEIGWRGFALSGLQQSMSPTRASLVVAMGWAAWHLPLFAFAGMAAMGPLEILGWLASIVAGSFLMTAWFNASGGSILVVALFHGVLDVMMTSPTGGPLQSVMGALVTVVGLTLPGLMARKRFTPPPHA
jgi:membrane protease YdiL (CAAX protease family)